MVSKKVHCAYCQKKCSGNVLRYQDQYYHKQCFEFEQQQQLQQQQQQLPNEALDLPSVASGEEEEEKEYLHQTNQRNTSISNQQQQQNVNNTTTHPGSIMSVTNGRPAGQQRTPTPSGQQRSATLPHSISSPVNGFISSQQQQQRKTLDNRHNKSQLQASSTTCAGCREKILDGQALIALDCHWHVWCFKCAQCRAPLHGEYVAKGGKAYCEKDYQKLFGISCVYCKRYISGKVLQAGEAHHFHPSCARCSKCGDPFVPGEEMYLQGEVTWHPRCGPGPPPNDLSSLGGGGGGGGGQTTADDRQSQTLRNSRPQSPSELSAGSRSVSPFSYMSRQYHTGRASPVAESEALGDLSRVYTISYLNADPNQGYLRRPIEPTAPKSPQFSRPTSLSRLGPQASGDRSRCSSRSTQQYVYSSASQLGASPRDSRSIPRGMYSVLSGMRGTSASGGGASSRARSPSMMNEEAIHLSAYPSGQKPAPDSLAALDRDDFPAPPFPYPQNHAHSRAQSASGGRATTRRLDGAANLNYNQQKQHSEKQERASRPRSREITNLEAKRADNSDADSTTSSQARDHGQGQDNSGDGGDGDLQFRKEEEELSKIANGIGKIFLQTLKEREKLRAWKRANLDPRNASRTPSATRELSTRPLRYENPLNASPSRDIDRPRPWGDSELAADSQPAGSDLQTTGEQSPAQTRSSLGVKQAAAAAAAATNYGYKVVQSNRSTPRPGYGCTSGPYTSSSAAAAPASSLISGLSFADQQRVATTRAADLLGRQQQQQQQQSQMNGSEFSATSATKLPDFTAGASAMSARSSTRSLASAAHFRRSMPNVSASLQHHHSHQEGPPKLYPYHLLATSNYRLPPDVDRCHLERHLSNEEFQYIFHCDRLDFYRLPEWKRNELKRRARLF